MTPADQIAVLLALDPAVRAMLAEDLPAQVREVSDALARSDFEQAISVVHSVHGSAAFCHLEKLRAAAAELEASLKNNDRNAELHVQFTESVHQILHALDNSTPGTME